MTRPPYLSFNLNAFNAGRPTTDLLVQTITDQISSVRQLPGCRLPPVRVLAHQLGISKNTVQRAYDELVARGLAESKKRVGLFLTNGQVKPPENTLRKIAAVPALRKDSLLGPYPQPKKTANASSPINLSAPVIHPSLLPREQFAACMRSVLKDPKLNVGAYPDPQGFLPLRRKIAERLNKRGIAARAEEIVTTLGSQQCLDLICQVLEDKKIGIENPPYAGAMSIFVRNNAKLLGLPLDPFSKGINLPTWERRIARAKPSLLYLIPSCQNPTGYSYTTTEMDQLIDWSAHYGFGILEDDWGSDMLSFSEFRPSLRTRGGGGVFYMNSFTKKLLPSLRLGYMVGSPETVPALLWSKQVSILSTPLLLEATLFEFLDRGYYDAHLKRMNAILDQRYHNFIDLLRQLMPAGVKWTSPGGGPILWLEMPPGVSTQNIKTDLAAENIFVNDFDRAFLGKPHLHGFRICYSNLLLEDLEHGLQRLAATIKKHM